MQTSKTRPLPDPKAFEPGPHPVREERVVRDHLGKVIVPPSIKEQRKVAKAARQALNYIVGSHTQPF